MEAIKNQRIPSYRLHRPSGQGVATIDGRDVYFGKHGTKESQERYDRTIQEWLASGRRSPIAPGGAAGLNVEEVLAAYVAFAEGYYRKDGKPTGELENLRLALRPVRALYGSAAAVEFGPRALKTVRETMIKSGLCRKQINARVGRIKRAFKWAVAEQMIPPSVFEGLRCVDGLRHGRSEAKESKGVGPVPEADVEKIIPHLPATIAAMVRVQLLTGTRPSEVCTMRTREIDRAGKVWIYKPTHHKTEHFGATREIAIGPKAQEILAPFLKLDQDAYLFAPSDAERQRSAIRRAARRTKLWPSHVRAQERARILRERIAFQDRYSVNAYRHAIHRACDAAGVPCFSPNQLRHTAATKLRREFGLDAARVVLGHRTPMVTEIYAEIDKGKALQIMEQVG